MILIKRKIMKNKITTIHMNKYIYSPHGSFLIFTKNVDFQFWNYFNSFLHDEEYYIAEELINTKMKILYRPDLKIIHDEHKVTKGLFNNDQNRKWHLQSINFIYNAYFK